MSKCINCLSYNDEHNLYYLYCKNDYACPYFTARSKWVPLPCKVGDKVYQTDGIKIYESTIREIEISSTNTVYCTENIAFDERAIGNSIFFTREEAEKALEEKK